MAWIIDSNPSQLKFPWAVSTRKARARPHPPMQTVFGHVSTRVNPNTANAASRATTRRSNLAMIARFNPVFGQAPRFPSRTAQTISRSAAVTARLQP